MKWNIFKKKRKLPFTIIVTREMIDFVNANRAGKNGKKMGYGDGFELVEGEKGFYKGDKYFTCELGYCTNINFPDGSGCVMPVELIKELDGYDPTEDIESKAVQNRNRRDDIAQEAFLMLLKKAIDKEKDIYFGDELPERLSKKAVEYANAMIEKLRND